MSVNTQSKRCAMEPAFSHGDGQHWHEIDWSVMHRTVRGLQVRVAKAAKESNWRKVKTLQRLLTHSFAAKALAVRRVTENRGRKTPGIDGETWSTPEDKWNAIFHMQRRGYQPKPLRRIYIPKANGKRRPLGIPTMVDRAMQALYLLALKSRRRARNKVSLVRYADDFIITGTSKELLENEVKPVVENFMAQRGLRFSPEKTLITHIETGFDFLGWNFRRYWRQGRQKVLVKPSKANIKAFLTKVRKIIKSRPGEAQASLIGHLNPVIRGWCNYHRAVVAKEVFSYVDWQIWKALWRWAKRRHNKKGKRWIAKRYWRTVKIRDWVFAADLPERDEEGNIQTVELMIAARVKIERHKKIKSEANPYDPDWESYFEARWQEQMKRSLRGRLKELHLWERQEGQCPVCRDRLKWTRRWDIHHLVPKTEGGSDKQSNLALLHPNCHMQVHSRNLNVTLPAPTG